MDNSIDLGKSLDNQEALRILARQLENELNKFKDKNSQSKLIFAEFIRKNLIYLVHNALILVVSILLLVSHHTQSIFNGIFLLIVSVFNFISIYVIFYKKKFAVFNRVCDLLRNINDHISIAENWIETSFFTFSMPESSTISTQLTYRSGKLLNLPINLIVQGDLVLIKAGQSIYIKCKNSLKEDQIFEIGDKHEISYKQDSKLPETLKCHVLQTPYITYLKDSLENYECKTDILLDNEMKKFLKIILIILIPIMVSIQIFIYSFYSTIILNQKLSKFNILIQSFLNSSVYSVLPLLPVSLFLFLHLVKLYGAISLVKAYKSFKLIKENYLKQFAERHTEDEQHVGKSERRVLLQTNSTDQFDAYLENMVNSSSLETNPTESIDSYIDIKTPSSTNTFTSQIREEFSLIKSIFYCKSLNFQDENIRFIYDTNFFIGLGTLTNFSCVDKQGILSWPNPTADTIWVFKNRQDEMRDDVSSQDLSDTEGEKHQQIHKDLNLETVNLNHSKIHPLKLEFDDAKSNFIKNSNLLKPLGLSILLNTCNKFLFDKYSQLDDYHLATSGKTHQNRHCLCEISRLINFQSNASDLYDMISSNTLTRTSPNSHISSVLSLIANYKYNGLLNLYSQGTSDLIIDLCSHYWDGRQVEKLKLSQRKRIFDLYNRHRVSSYCIAFSYKPLVDNTDMNYSSHAHIECPSSDNEIWIENNSQTSSLNEFESKSYDFNVASAGNQEESALASRDRLFDMHLNQIFIGMISMQFKARLEVIKLIEKLTKACIRFVHFSYDNEQISRVFGQYLGLDTGWNCHISLVDDHEMSVPTNAQEKLIKKVDKCSNNSLLSQITRWYRDTSLNRSLPNLKNPQISFDSQAQTVKFNLNSVSTRQNSCLKPVVAKLRQDDESSHRTIHSGRTLSDNELLGNAARLPKGIGNIRNHLENVDNVPLHVSLFTDCSKDSIKQMLTILQDYGEIVCCLGSSLSSKSMNIFSKANLSISIAPLYPTQCMKHKGFDNVNDENTALNPIDLSVQLNSISCGFTLKHDNLSLLPCIMSTARELVHSFRICLLFMVMCNLTLSLMNILTSLLFIPSLLSDTQMLIVVLVVIPALSFSLINKKDGENSLRCSTKKNTKTIDNNEIFSFLAQFFSKFFPTICILAITHCLTLYFNCAERNPQKKCSIMLLSIFQNNITNTLAIGIPVADYTQLSQSFNFFFINFYLILLSMQYVCIEKSLWSYMPFRNKVWTASIVTIFLINLIYVTIDLLMYDQIKSYFRAVPIIIWCILVIIWPIMMLSINELIKVFEIKETVRKYKKLRLEFDTKLGLNSPFV